MNEIQARTELADSLAMLFEQYSDQKRILQSAGFEITHFNFGGRSDISWLDILNELHKNREISTLLKAARGSKGYPTNPELLQRELLWLSSQIPNIEEQWQALFINSCPPLLRSRCAATTVMEAIDFLCEQMCQSNGDISLLRFGEQLADFAGSDSIANEIRDWVTATAQNHCKITDYHVTRHHRVEVTTQTRPVYLQLILRADHANINRTPQAYRFHLQIAWWSNELQQTLSVSEQPLKFSEIRGKVKDTLRNDIKNLLNKTMELRIECFLSMDVLCDLFDQKDNDLCLHTVDQWVLRERGSIQTKCGHDHPVMLRLLDRFEDSDATEQQLWQQRWDKFTTHPDDSCDELALWIGKEDQHTGATLYRELSDNKSLAFLGARFAPAQLEELEDILNALLASGTPLALLPRECADATAANNICTHVHTAHLTQLPQTVKALRAQERRDPDHFGKHLTLLWDDPTRIPKLHPFVAP